jgi:hypothetical protein
MIESDSKAAKLEKWSLHDRSKGERGIVRVECVCVCVCKEKGGMKGPVPPLH